MKIWQTNAQGHLLLNPQSDDGSYLADHNQLSPGEFIIPVGAYSDVPPPAQAGSRIVRRNGSWTQEPIPPADPPAQAPDDGNAPVTVVSPLQAFLALQQAGLLEQIYAYINAPDTPVLVRLAFYGATEWRRDSLLMMNTAIVLDLSPQQVDDLFAAAAAIPV